MAVTDVDIDESESTQVARRPRRPAGVLVIAVFIALLVGAVGGFAVGRGVSGSNNSSDTAGEIAVEGPSTTTTLDATAQVPPPITAPEPLTDRPPVVIIGNSITYLTEERLRDQLSTDFNLSVRGVPGMHIEQSYPLIDDYLGSTEPYAVVIQLGTNDAGAHDDDAVAAYEALVERLEGVSCPILVTVTTHSPDAEYAAVASELNAWIRLGAIAGEWRTVDWDATVGAYFAEGEPFGPLTTDLVHPTPLGQHLLAAEIADEVRSCR